MSEKCGTQKNTGMGLQDVWNWRRNLDGGSRGREKQVWGTEEKLFLQRRKRKAKTQESWRGLWSGRNYLEYVRLPHSRWNMEQLMPSLLSPLWPSIILASGRNHQAASQGHFPVWLSANLLSSSPIASQTEHDPVVIPGPLSAFCLQKNFSQRISLNVFCFSLTTCSILQWSAEF